MPPNGESGPGAQDEAEKARQEIAAKAKEINDETDAKVKVEKTELLREELLKEFKQRKIAALEAQDRGVENARDEAKAVKLSTVRILEAINQGIIAPPDHSRKLFADLASKPLMITDNVAANLYEFVSTYLNEDIIVNHPGQAMSEFEKALDELSARDSLAGSIIRDSILENPADYNLSQAEAETRLNQELGQKNATTAKESDFEQRRYTVMRQLNVEGASTSVIRDEESLRVAEALISKENLLTFINRIETEVRGRGITDEQEIQKIVSEELELKIILFYDNIFTNLDLNKPTKYYQEITQKDPYYNFQVVFERLEKRLGELAKNIEDSKETLGPVATNQDFWKIDHERSDEEREYTSDVDGTKRTERYLIDRIRPYPIRKASTLSDYLKYLQIVVNHEQDMREFLHNATAMFHNPAGEGGFYKQLAGYAEKMRSSDIDMFLATADNKYFMEAFDLYHKFTQKEFAKYDWQHPEALFEVYQGNMTKIEHQVIDMLTKMHRNDNVEKWRLVRAMKMAVGASLGVFMTEVENAAYADPNLDPKGSFTFKSYYRNDTAAIGPLNPFTHEFYRWQQAGTLMNDLLFLPIKQDQPDNWWQRLKPKNWKIYDHTGVYAELKKYRGEFEARQKMTPLEKSTRLIDMENPGRIGGPITRAGWRTFYSYEDWMVYKMHDGRATEHFDFQKSWDAIENIGFEPLLNFVSSKFDLKHFKNDAELKKFFRHVYDNYKTAGDPGFDSYYKDLEEKIAGETSKLKGTGKVKEELIKDKKKELYQDELFKILSRVLKQRVPTIFLRLERGRFMEKGKKDRILDKLQKKYGVGEAEKIVDNLLLAETLLREETSTKMIEGIEQGKKLHDIDYGGYKYELTGEKLTTLLEASGIAQDEIDKTVEALIKIRKDYLTPEYLNAFSLKIKENGKGGPRTDLPFAIAPDEFDMRFINFRSSGSRMLARLTGELSLGEEKMHAHLKNFGKILKETSVDPKHDLSNIVKALEDIEGYLEQLHGKSYAYQWVDHLSQVTIAYFRKDTLARNIFTKFFRVGKYNSLAAEISGKRRGVWEWEVAEIHQFISELESRDIIRKDPFDISQVKVVPRTILGVHSIFGVSLGNRVIRKKEYTYSGHKLREMTGSTALHMGWEMVNKYIPLFLLALLFLYAKSAFKEASGEKQQ